MRLASPFRGRFRLKSGPFWRPDRPGCRGSSTIECKGMSRGHGNLLQGHCPSCPCNVPDVPGLCPCNVPGLRRQFWAVEHYRVGKRKLTVGTSWLIDRAISMSDTGRYFPRRGIIMRSTASTGSGAAQVGTRDGSSASERQARSVRQRLLATVPTGPPRGRETGQTI